MSIKEKIKLFWHDSEQTNYKAVAGESGRFDLYINKLLVGTLTFQNNKWRFVYSDDFKNQSEYVPLVNFPSINQVYESDQLWPFFASRLPGSTQLNDSAENSSVIELLRKYGQHVITNPYKLQMI